MTDQEHKCPYGMSHDRMRFGQECIYCERDRYRAALWEIIDEMRMVDAYHLGVREILAKYKLPIHDHIRLL